MTDSDKEEELKPDVVAPGSDIISAAHAASSSQLPGTPKPLAEDSYTEQSGTSMACPAVAGLVAVILQISVFRSRFLHLFMILPMKYRNVVVVDSYYYF